VYDRVARGTPADDEAHYEQRSLPDHVEVVQGFLHERVAGVERHEDALRHRYPFLELLVLEILGVHDDGNRDGH